MGKSTKTFDDLLVFGNIKVLDSIEVKRDIKASQFIGNLKGKADVADRASKDVLDQDIESTYIKDVEPDKEDGTLITLTKGNGETISFHTKDTTYETGTEETSGLTKLYSKLGNNTDGTLTQKALNEKFDTKLDKKDKFNAKYNEDTKQIIFSYAE